MKVKAKNACPFCGCLSTQVLGPPNSAHGKGFQVECVNCGARGPSGMIDPENAIKVWDLGDIPDLYKRPFIPDPNL